MYLGIDIGSTSTKAALIDGNGSLAAQKVVNIGTGTNGLDLVLAELFQAADVTMEDVEYTVATGYGRLLCAVADKQITEISCHAKGVSYLVRGTGTIIDIGGQDSKVIRLDPQGRVMNFAMNEKCAAGTGRFLEVMGRVLGCSLDELSELAGASTREVQISSVCTVFAESEVISQLSMGTRREDVAKGALVSIAKRVAGLCKRVGVEPRVVMTGGVALNKNMVAAMSRELNEDVQAAPYTQAVGAIGAALFALEAAGKKENSNA
ncbi:MAG TPA: 2-hydroxyglutaryl-CoA dehydratase [Clostridiales bacterium]|nr:2-hydroxyglutaryl-CoA dehydratase [Clostridiales bacterium]